MSHSFNTITQRHSTYPAIDPLLPQHSTKGKTVLITAGTTGVGKSVARAFAISGARRIFVALRNREAHREACKQLQDEYPGVVFEVVQVSLDSLSSIETLWQTLKDTVDIVVLSAAHSPHRGPSTTIDAHDATAAMTTNIVGNWEMARHYLASCQRNGVRGSVVDVSSGAAHSTNGRNSVYGASKIGSSFLLAALASENPAHLRLFSMHPGMVWSTMGEKAGYRRADLPVDDDDLVGSFVVWLVAGEKPWLEGRFVWATWDVDELANRKAELSADETLLTLGLIGWAGPSE